MRYGLAGILSLCLAACTAGPAGPGGGAGVQPEVSLVGKWHVAAIDGRMQSEPGGLGLEGDSRMVWWAPQCARQERLYTIEGSAVRFTRNPELRPAPGQPGVPVCLIGLSENLDGLMRALDSAERITRKPDDSVEITGGGHSLTLVSQ